MAHVDNFMYAEVAALIKLAVEYSLVLVTNYFG